MFCRSDKSSDDHAVNVNDENKSSEQLEEEITHEAADESKTVDTKTDDLEIEAVENPNAQDDDHNHVVDDVLKQDHVDDEDHDDDNDYDWWVLKASKSNGGREVWVCNRSNYQKVMNQLIDDDEYILQK